MKNRTTYHWIIGEYEIIRSPGSRPVWVVFRGNAQLGKFTKLFDAKTFIANREREEGAR